MHFGLPKASPSSTTTIAKGGKEYNVQGFEWVESGIVSLLPISHRCEKRRHDCRGIECVCFKRLPFPWPVPFLCRLQLCVHDVALAVGIDQRAIANTSRIGDNRAA
eukprot:scaffold258_cov258-Ochromonas_danica.AAC.1